MPQLAPTPGAAADRRGFTLPELVVAMVLFSIVAGTLLTVLERQQRFYRSANEIIDTRSQLRQATGLLPLDLRSMSTVGRDLLVMEPTRVQLLGNFGSGVVCERPTVGASDYSDTFYLPPLNAEANTYTTWFMPPLEADSVFVYDENLDRGAVDDRWVRFAIHSIEPVTDATICAPTATPSFTRAGENSKPRWKVRVRVPGKLVDGTDVAAIPDSVKIGAGVRFERPVEYRLYQPSATGEWFLGFRERRADAWTDVQPLAGPYRAPGAAPGLGFRYFTDVGAEVFAGGDLRTVARVDMIVRGEGTDRTNAISRDAASGVFQDSLRVRVAVRNRQ